MSLSTGSARFQFTPTQDWFSHNIESWKSLFPLIRSRQPRALEIGSWEGRSAVFLQTNLCKDGGEIVCIDHFDLFHTEAGRQRYSRINHNLCLTRKSFRILPMFSFPALMLLLEEEMGASCPGFDWIYIDGSHEADDTLLDGELAWRLARRHSIVIFDDYHWDKEPEDSIHHPKRGIDAFLNLHSGEYERLSDTSHYQVVLRKLTAMRIGFLVGEENKGGLNEALGYGINIAFTINSLYAMPAAVSIQSIIETTPGRISVYIVDCGLSEEDRGKLKEVVSGRNNVTLLFILSSGDSLTKELGATWAKLEILDILPVERVLYLDADVLVRSSVQELWDIDLEGKSIAAVTDIGHPMGHGAFKTGPYFNAGVILMDLAKVRTNGDALKSLGRTMTDAKFRDQDALNVHFAGDWLPLHLKWNAQGLGTYAEYPSPERDALDLAEMDNPCIVHFTGPVHPEMIQVLNPYIQPPTAKPWGYAGAPGHPFCDEWWTMLEKTPWKGLRSTEGWKAMCAHEGEKAIELDVGRFREQVFNFHA